MHRGCSACGVSNRYLTNDRRVINDVFGIYTTFLLEGFTIKIDSKTVVQTMREYLLAVNEHYKGKGFDIPYVRNNDSQISNLLYSAEEFEGAAAKQNPLNHKMIVMMHHLAQDNLLRFKAAVYDFTTLGCFGAFRRQEFAIDSKTKICYYFLSDGTKVVRAFTVKNFISYDVDACRIDQPLKKRDLIKKLGTEYDVQNNCTNGQVINFA